MRASNTPVLEKSHIYFNHDERRRKDCAVYCTHDRRLSPCYHHQSSNLSPPLQYSPYVTPAPQPPPQPPTEPTHPSTIHSSTRRPQSTPARPAKLESPPSACSQSINQLATPTPFIPERRRRQPNYTTNHHHPAPLPPHSHSHSLTYRGAGVQGQGQPPDTLAEGKGARVHGGRVAD